MFVLSYRSTAFKLPYMNIYNLLSDLLYRIKMMMMIYNVETFSVKVK